MGEARERMLDSRVSVWGTETRQVPVVPGWVQRFKAWQRLADALLQALPARQERQTRQTASADGQLPERSSGELTTLPLGGRGRALREAHGALRQHLRRHPGLRRVLPHLYFIERSLARQGSAALLEMPVWVMQRGLQQLMRLPFDVDAGPGSDPLHMLRLRLVEAIETRSLPAAEFHQVSEAADSFNGSLDSQFSIRGPLSLPPAGIVVDDEPSDPAFDHLSASTPHRQAARRR